MSTIIPGQVGLGCIGKLAEHDPENKPVIESKAGQNQSQRSKNDTTEESTGRGNQKHKL